MESEKLGVCLTDKKATKENSFYLIINVAIIIILCSLLFGLLFMIPSKKQRKKRVNELDEDYEYTKT